MITLLFAKINQKNIKLNFSKFLRKNKSKNHFSRYLKPKLFI